MTSEGIESCTDDELIGMIRAGGKVRDIAWSDMLRRHTPKMYAVARSFEIDHETVEDLVQTVWLRFLERSDQLREHCFLGSMALHDRAKRGSATGDPAQDGSRRRWMGPAPSRHPVTRQRDRRNRAGQGTTQRFAKLGEDCRTLLTLLLADPPLSYDEIAAALDRPRGSLGPTRQRCLDRLRRLLPAGLEIRE